MRESEMQSLFLKLVPLVIRLSEDCSGWLDPLTFGLGLASPESLIFF